MEKLKPEKKKNSFMSGISANVLLLGIVSMLTDLSSEMIMPILPMFITALGGTGLAIGLIGGLDESISSILKIISGYYSDKVGRRKPFIFAGYAMSAVSKLFFPLATAWWHVAIIRPIERIGKGVRNAPRDALLADSTHEDHMGKSFGIHRAFDSFGAVLGSISALIMFWFLGFDFRLIFTIAAIIAFSSLIPIIFVKEKAAEPKKISIKLGFSGLSNRLKMFILIAGIFSMANITYMFFILKAQAVFAGNFVVIGPILLYILYNVVYTLLSIPSGMLSDKIGRKKVLLAGYFLFTLTLIGLIFANSISLFIILFALYGIVYALVEGNQRALITDLSKKELRGTSLGTFHMFISLATLPGNLIAGYLWNINTDYTFFFAALMALIALILLFFWTGR